MERPLSSRATCRVDAIEWHQQVVVSSRAVEDGLKSAMPAKSVS